MPTSRPTSFGTAAAGLLAQHELHIRMKNERELASDAPFFVSIQSQSDLLSERLQTVLEHALSAAVRVVEYELYDSVRSGVIALLKESSEPVAIEALASMMTTRTSLKDGECRVHAELDAEADPDDDDMGSAFAQLLAIGLANRAGIGVRWLVARAREVDWEDPASDDPASGKSAARWADIATVLRITPQAAAKRFGNDHTKSTSDAVWEALETVLADTLQKRI
ncbi:hypothetical protein AB4Z39_05180 [Mycobacterium adipatum]|uniref:hypothetical protein n=1 Tax=Mycobacterium adipatum TaxID=1682113 RepID=UPI0034E09FCE